MIEKKNVYIKMYTYKNFKMSKYANIPRNVPIFRAEVPRSRKRF